MANTLKETIESRLTSKDKALYCLERASEYGEKDLAYTELLAAANVFGLLAIADALTTTGSGRNLADTVSLGAELMT